MDSLIKSGSLIILVFVMFILGCSKEPSESNARQVVENLLQKQTEGKVKLVDFKVLDVQEGDVNGINILKFAFDAEIEFLEDCYYYIKESEHFPGLVLGNTFKVSICYPYYSSNSCYGYDEAYPSLREKFYGEITFEKTKKGWKGLDGEFY